MKSDAVTNDLLAVLRSPQRLNQLGRDRATDVIARARSIDVLGRIGARAHRMDQMGAMPERVQGVLEAALTAAQAFHRMARFETDRVRRVLRSLGHDIILLKGSAYVVAKLPSADGRRQSDVDIMLPRDTLATAEALLLAAGWLQAKTNDYDQLYFRQWMHELPPLYHRERDTMIDLHHTILPLTGRLVPNPRLLLADAVPVEGWPGIRVLAPADMTLHSIVHHFQDGEFQHSLRELVDLDDLLRHFAVQSGFWEKFIERMEVHGFGRPTFYALRYVSQLLETPIPANVTMVVRRYAPPAPLLALMDRLIPTCLMSGGRLPRSLQERAASNALFLRAHWLKMPPALLARHTMSKFANRFRRA